MDNWNIYSYGFDAVVTVPSNLSINTQKLAMLTGNIQFILANPIDYLSIKTITGNTLVSNTGTIGNLILSNTTGNININCSKVDKADMSVTTGNIDLLLNNTSDLQAKLVTGNINLTIGGLKSMNMGLKTGNINATINSFNGYTNNSYISSITGNVSVDFEKAGLDSLKVSASVSTGSVNPSFDFDKTALKNGSTLNAYNGTGLNELNIFVTTGNINLKKK